MDSINRRLLGLLQEDADRTYVELGDAVGLSAPAAHERVRKLRVAGTIRRTTIEVDPSAVGKEMLVFVMIDSTMWCGDESTTKAFEAIDGIEAAYAVAGKACLMVKIRVGSPVELQRVLKQVYEVEEVHSTESIVVLDTLFERPLTV